MTPNQREDMDRNLEYEEKFHPLNRIQPSWWNRHSEEIGLLLWMVALTLGGAALWLALDGTLKWFR